MFSRGAYFFVFLILLGVPTLADGWFTDPVVVLKVEHGDVQEIRELLGTLVPDVRYEVRGQKILGLGDFGALEEVRELFTELDRPLNWVFFEILGFEVLGEHADFPGGYWERMRFQEDIHSSPGGGPSIELWSFRSSHPLQMETFLAGELKIRSVFSEIIEAENGTNVDLYLPAGDGVSISERGGAKLSINVEVLQKGRLGLKLTLKAPGTKWHREARWMDGRALLLTGASQKFSFMITPHILR